MNEIYNKIIKDPSWKEIKTFSGYFINKNGEVLSTNRNKYHILSQQKNSKGYMYLTLRQNGKHKKIQIHKTVAENWVINPEPENYDIVNHKDGNKQNNKHSNLEWTNLSGNTKHAIENGLKIITKGEECSWSKLDENKILEIRKLYDSKKYTNQEIANMFNVSRGNISQIGRRITWKHIK